MSRMPYVSLRTFFAVWVTKILQGRQKGFSGTGGELGVCWGSVESIGPGPGQPTCSVMVTSRPLRLQV